MEPAVARPSTSSESGGLPASVATSVPMPALQQPSEQAPPTMSLGLRHREVGSRTKSMSNADEDKQPVFPTAVREVRKVSESQEEQPIEFEVDLHELMGQLSDRAKNQQSPESLKEYQAALAEQIDPPYEYLPMLNLVFRDWVLVVMDIGAAVYIYFKHTINFEASIVVFNSVMITYFYLSYTSVGGHPLGAKLDMSILSFAVVFPLTYLFQQAFTRREAALAALADIKALLVNENMACMTWDFPHNATKKFNGRTSLPAGFAEKCASDALTFLRLLYEFLSLPAVSRARHFIFPVMKRERRRVHLLQDNIVQQLSAVTRQMYRNVETLKVAGLPANEASRINQYHWFIQQRFELLRNVKYYRTPQVGRSLGRFYIIVLPWYVHATTAPPPTPPTNTNVLLARVVCSLSLLCARSTGSWAPTLCGSQASCRDIPTRPTRRTRSRWRVSPFSCCTVSSTAGARWRTHLMRKVASTISPSSTTSRSPRSRSSSTCARRSSMLPLRPRPRPGTSTNSRH
jgi:hypothetical protein